MEKICLPAPSTEAAIPDDEEDERAAGQVGEICIRGPQAKRGHWNRPDETDKVFTRDDRFRSGDMRFVNENGFIEITDCQKDMIRVSGLNLCPSEVEDAVMMRPGALGSPVDPVRGGAANACALARCAWGALLACALTVAAGSTQAQRPSRKADFEGLLNSSFATSLVNDLAEANRKAFFVYRDADSGLNHGFPSGIFPGPLVSKLRVNAACVPDDGSPGGCSTDPERLDRVRGTVVQVQIDPLAGGEFVGINWEQPEHFGVLAAGRGYDLRGAERACVLARSPTPGLRVRFGVAGHQTRFLRISSRWTRMCFGLAALGLRPADLADVHALFTVVTDDAHAPAGGTLLLDDIQFEPPPGQRSTPSLPAANIVSGIVRPPAFLPGRVPVPPDQILANAATTYESAMAVLALLARGGTRDLANARSISDALVYALGHDNSGLPLPPAPDGSRGLHSAMMSGDLPLLNDQGPGAGRTGEIRLAGFSTPSDACGPSRFCVFLDGATGGNNAFAMLALTASYLRFGDTRHLDAARTIGRWIHLMLHDGSGTGFGGYFLGFPDNAEVDKPLVRGKSVENNADIFRAFALLATVERELGNEGQAAEWESRARIAGDFVIAMYNPIEGRFRAGTVPFGTLPGPGISPDGEVRGDEVINTFDFLDAQTFTTLALASSSIYRDAIDWRRPVDWMLGRFAVEVDAAGRSFRGFSLIAGPSRGPRGVAWEFTAQAIVAMNFVDRLYAEHRFAQTAGDVLLQMRKAVRFAPFADRRGLVAATLEGGDAITPRDQCLSTPIQCIAQRIGLAATTWYVFAERDVNPFDVPLR